MQFLKLLTMMFCLVAIGCATSYKIDVPLGEERTFEPSTPGLRLLKVRRIQVQSPANLKAMVANRHSYRLDFFRQSKDPYFGKERWSSSCLQRNPTGAIEENSDGIFFRSKATADAGLKTEVCLENSIDVVQLIGECRRQQLFFEITATGPEAASLKFRCPDEIFF